MLVKITDTRGNDHWINPLYVKWVQPKRGGSEVRVGTDKIRTALAPQEVADMISSALVAMNPSYAAPLITEEEIARQQQQAAAAAVASGG